MKSLLSQTLQARQVFKTATLATLGMTAITLLLTAFPSSKGGQPLQEVATLAAGIGSLITLLSLLHCLQKTEQLRNQIHSNAPIEKLQTFQIKLLPPQGNPYLITLNAPSESVAKFLAQAQVPFPIGILKIRSTPKPNPSLALRYEIERTIRGLPPFHEQPFTLAPIQDILQYIEETRG